MSEKKICLIVNPYAGDGRALKILPKIEKKLAALKLNFTTFLTNDIEHAQEIAKAGGARGETIAIMGGDGTLRAIAHALKYTNIPLAIIPIGRGNDLARVLNISLNPLEACTNLSSRNEILIDMAEVNGQGFLGICSLGFDSIANQIANRTNWISGPLVYAYAGLRALINWKPIKFSVEIDGHDFAHTGYTVAVANSKCYGGGMLLAPLASLTDGLLDIVLIGDISKYRIIKNLPRVFKGLHTKEPGFTMLTGKHVMINTDHKYTVFADGDAICPPPADIQVLPKALRIVIPS